MGKRKLAQKNTLAQWAGVEPRSTVLIFKIDVDKLKAVCRPRLIQNASSTSTIETEVDEASRAADRSTSLTAKTREAAQGKEDVEPHPFFVRKKKQAVLVPQANGDIVPKAQQPTQVKPHAFFNPRPTASKVQHSEVDLPNVPNVRMISAPMPSRETMHVKTNSSLENQHGTIPNHMLGKRKRSKGPSACEEAWSYRSFRDCMKADSEFHLEAKICFDASVAKAKLQDKKHSVTTRNTNIDAHVQQHQAIERYNQKPRSSDDANAELGSLWTVKHRPRIAEEVLSSGTEAPILRNWLLSRRLHLKDRLTFASRKGSNLQSYPDEYDDFIVDDSLSGPPTANTDTSFEQEKDQIECPTGRELLWRSNLIVLTGPHGCGKSAAIQAVAEELDFEIFEVNAMDRRSSKDVLEHVGEASQSQMVNKQKAADGSQSKSMLLFEEVDILFRDDKDFWLAIISLASTSKRPVILTCNDTTVLPTQFDVPSLILHFKRPRFSLMVEYLEAVARVEHADTSTALIEQQIVIHDGDLRATINSLQFLCLSRMEMRNPVRGTALTNELISRQMPVTDIFCPISTSSKRLRTKRHRELFSQFDRAIEVVSLIDMLSSQQPSLGLEHEQIFENESDDMLARSADKDDLIGLHMLSEPYGRYTRPNPGDTDMAFWLAEALSEASRARQPKYRPLWQLQDHHLDTHSVQQKQQERSDKMWTIMMEACDALTVPENWMQDYAPHNCIDRARLSGILPGQILPYLREMARIEDEREEVERGALANHTGRMTRNTIFNEFGMAWRRPVKWPAALRTEILTTALQGQDKTSIDS